jgi:oxygen-dependent protoporphyrinogen oxidase
MMKHAFAFLLGLVLLSCASPAGPVEPARDGLVIRDINGKRATIRVMGFRSEKADTVEGAPEGVKEPYDVIVVGGGLSGLCAGWYLRDKRTVILERKDEAGGLAFRGVTEEGVIYARGSAYYSRPVEDVLEIYKDLGMDDLDKTAIPEPIDAYWRVDGGKGALVNHMWEEEALKVLPEGFRKFKQALLAADEKGLVHNQPIDKGKKMQLDRMTAAEWIKPYGPELKAYLDSYCQSALGGLTDDVNALAFANFYLSEIDVRHAWPGGSAGASVHMVKKIRETKPELLKTGCTVTKVRNVEGGVEVDWHEGGRNYRAKAKAAIVTTPLRVTAWIVEGYPAERKELVSKLKYADYVVHSVFTSKEHYTRCYDTWFINRSITDVITARWIETKGFKEPAKGGPGVLSIYQPLAPHRKIAKLDPDVVADLAVSGIKDLFDVIPELASEAEYQVESYRWPASIHIVPVNFFSEWAPKLAPPVGRVYFAGNNLGTPSFEEALYRGKKAADEARAVLGVRIRPRPVEYAR